MWARVQLKLSENEDFSEELSRFPPLSELIDGIEKVKFFTYEDSDYNIEQSMFDELETDVSKEGYESLLTVRTPKANMNFLMKESPRVLSFLPG